MSDSQDTPTQETPPDRLSLNPRSQFFDGNLIQRGVGIRFKGKERHNVIEYCLSQGWIRVQAGRSMDRYGQPMTVKLKGPVEAWFMDVEDTAADGEDTDGENEGSENATASEEEE